LREEKDFAKSALIPTNVKYLLAALYFFFVLIWLPRESIPNEIERDSGELIFSWLNEGIYTS